MKNTLAFLLLLCGFVANAQNRYDLLIHEIFCDPSPVVGLPSTEYVEIKNVADSPVDLRNWKLSDATTSGRINSSFILWPDSLVVLSTVAGCAALQLNNCIGIASFPSLDNEEDLLTLISPQGRIMHAVSYRSAWYRNALKAEGGWSLEMIDERFPCLAETNWKASEAAKGGTPGLPNTAWEVVKDELPPHPLYAFCVDSLTTLLVFSETVDSLAAVKTLCYGINNGIGQPKKVDPLPPLFDRVRIEWERPLQENTIYSMAVTGVPDCFGNQLREEKVLRTGLSQSSAQWHCVVNEILFAAEPLGQEYVELFNKGPAIADLKELYLTIRREDGSLDRPARISAESRLLLPGQFAVLAKDADSLQKRYPVQENGVLLGMNDWPGLPNDGACLVLMNDQGESLEEVCYRDDWHFELLTQTAGVALERLDANQPSNEKNNWHSAAAPRYGTPGASNSQHRNNAAVGDANDWTGDPAVISPDNDGRDDFLMIHYKETEPGKVCTITIYDMDGRRIRRLVKNALCGREGQFRWDGLDESGKRLVPGLYIWIAELFDINGKISRIKRTVVIAG